MVHVDAYSSNVSAVQHEKEDRYTTDQALGGIWKEIFLLVALQTSVFIKFPFLKSCLCFLRSIEFQKVVIHR